MSLIPASMAFAIPTRAKTLNVLETLVIGTAGGALFLVAHLPGGLTSGAMIAVGIAAIAGRPLVVPSCHRLSSYRLSSRMPRFKNAPLP